MCRKSGMTVDGLPIVTLVANLPRKSQQEPIRADAVKVIQETLLDLKRKKLAKPKIFLVGAL
jgi:eukaryotic translation initiation factor 2C